MNLPRPKRGEQHHLCKISDAQAAQLKPRRQSGESLREIARDLGVHHSTVKYRLEVLNRKA